MDDDSQSEDIFEPFEFVPQPTAGCGFIQPIEITTNKFHSDESREFQLAHVATCTFCLQKVEHYYASQSN